MQRPGAKPGVSYLPKDAQALLQQVGSSHQLTLRKSQQCSNPQTVGTARSVAYLGHEGLSFLESLTHRRQIAQGKPEPECRLDEHTPNREFVTRLPIKEDCLLE